jgi:hypothetical protein
MFSKKELMICRACGHQGLPKKKVKGSLGLELVLWVGAVAAFLLMFPFGGLLGVVALVYSLWRASSASRVKVCPACQREGTLIPLDTPEGKRIAASYTTPPIIKR